MRCHDTLAKQVNNVLYFFRNLDPMIKLWLLVSYCYSLYVLWDACNGYIEQHLCHTWRVAVRRLWSLPHNTHDFFLPLICCRLLLMTSLWSAFWYSCCGYGRMLSPVGRNVLHCSLRMRYNFTVSKDVTTLRQEEAVASSWFLDTWVTLSQRFVEINHIIYLWNTVWQIGTLKQHLVTTDTSKVSSMA